MRLLVRKWGNSASVRIPATLMTAAGIALDQVVDMREEDGRLIIEPVRDDTPPLADLLAGITEENLHGEADFGAPAGAEIW